MTQARQRLDDLLARLPASVPEPPPRAVTTSSVSDSHWERMLRTTLERIDGERSGRVDDGAATAARFDIDDVLRTPLPVAADERRDEVAETEHRNGFEDLFANDSEDFDPLRAPLKSGEHAQLPTATQPHHGISTAATIDTARTRKRPSFLVWGGAGTLAAAAALVLALRPASPPIGSEATKVVAADKNVTTAHQQPSPAQAGPGISPTSPALAKATTESAATDATQATAPAGETTQEAVAAMARASASKVVVGGGAMPKAMKGSAASRAPAAAAEPALEPAAGPTSLPDHPSTGAVSAALSSRTSAARACVSTGGKRVMVAITFRSSGEVQQVAVADPSLTATERKCISSAFAGAKVDPFARARFDVNYPLSLP
ncbi:MAG: hypothetical protein QM784_02295 [Polyangiaceae bacterium]